MAHSLEQAEWRDIQNILKETFEIWSPGLTHEKYLEFIWMQLQHPWARNNYEYLMTREGARSESPLASMKYYKISLASRGRSFPFAGFGAIYSRMDVRGQGYGRELIELAIDKARKEGCQGIMLFSDIDPKYYERFGFIDMSNQKFFLALEEDLNAGEFEPNPIVDDSFDRGASSRSLTAADQMFPPELESIIQYRFLDTSAEQIDLVTRHYGRWLRRQQFGVERDSLYFHFKIFRENFLADHSNLAWPRLELVTVNMDMSSGYAIIEYGGRVVRILELVGDEETRRYLWLGVLMRARQLNAIRISGWESILADLGPGYSVHQFETIDSSLAKSMRTLLYAQKLRGRYMLLPFCPEVERWTYSFPNPILELDHL